MCSCKQAAHQQLLSLMPFSPLHRLPLPHLSSAFLMLHTSPTPVLPQNPRPHLSSHHFTCVPSCFHLLGSFSPSPLTPFLPLSSSLSLQSAALCPAPCGDTVQVFLIWSQSEDASDSDSCVSQLPTHTHYLSLFYALTLSLTHACTLSNVSEGVSHK